MAAVTCNLSVLPLQSEFGGPVVKYDALPARAHVAVATDFTQGALVLILLAVTVKTGSGSFSIFIPGLMAAHTRDANVGPLDGKVSVVMIESRLVEQHNVCIPACMIGMALLARSILDVRALPMEALPGLNIGIDCFMAVETQSSLGAFTKTYMAFRAFRFVVGVSRDDSAGHQQRFDFRGGQEMYFEQAHRSQYQNRSRNPVRHGPFDPVVSVHVHGDYVYNAGNDEHQKQWEVHQVPDRKQAFIEVKFGDLAYTGKMCAYITEWISRRAAGGDAFHG